MDAKNDEEDDASDAEDSKGDRGAEVDINEVEDSADLKGHEPDVVDLGHYVSELLGIKGHVVDDHVDAMGLASRAGEAKALVIDGGDKGTLERRSIPSLMDWKLY
ncbi:hypothetical protein COCNU_11G012280 [Cocos nucifera]|uniref:Uncharacterized protein n=1 Tax=Cocos nucifera TaxID=13894 RepID=A0A8K0N9F4_COCNU|nr:hypothetical protein COCNU_11G012280 [Cocos nucifera]